MRTPATAEVRTPSVRVVVPLVVLVAALVVVPLIVALQVGRVGPQPQGLEVGVSGPVLVAQSIADRVEALPGDPFEAAALPETDEPAAAVAGGLLDAVVRIDFCDDRDLLFVASSADPDLVAEVEVRLEAISSTYGRTLDVVRVPTARSADGWRGTPFVMVVVWVLLGVVVSVGLSWLRGPAGVGGREAVLRVVVVTGLALVGGLGVALGARATSDTGLATTAAVGALTVAATAWLVRGAEALLGLAGVAVAVSFSLGGLAPLLVLTDVAALPQPWSDVVPWTPPGAALALAENDVFFGAATGLRPWSVLLSWALVGLLVIAASIRGRPRTAGEDEA